ncbi:MAG: hypothetical protein HY318_11395 [Armatimonadetes bacterium]|nr:hypothetical protein [Armatimonadota bacterium]
MVLLCYFMDSMTFMAVGQPNVQAALQNDDYGLYPAFIDGWLEVIPPTVTLVDGGENAYLYLYDSPNQYLAAAAMVRGAGQELVSPELRAKYRAQVQVGFGFFLDAYRNPPSTWFNIQAKAGGSRVDRLRENVSTALRVADEYVWIYGHLSQGQWWPPSNTNHWSKTLPGCEEALRSAREFVRDPIKYGRAKVEEMKNAGTLVNLMINGDFSLEEAKTQGSAAADWVAGPAGWFFTAAKGTCAWDRAVGATAKGSARTVEVNSGCLVQKVAVKPGEHYAVRTVCKLQGQGSAWVRISWQSPEEKWAKGECDKQFFPAGSAKEWEEIFGIVEVPEGVGQLGILLSVSGETSPEDMAWFDDVQLCKLR